MQIENGNFIVTGGSSGLGSGVVKLFSSMGATITILDVNEEGGAAIAEECGDGVTFIKTDVSDEAQVQAAIDQAIDANGPLNGVINCAGIVIGERVVGRSGPHSLSSFSKVIQVNLVGSFNVMRLAAEKMIANETNAGGERGVVVNTASVAAYEGQIGQVAYSASKGGIVGMTLPAARELAKFGVRVNTIAPGIFGTPMLGGMPQKVQDSLAAAVPFPSRLGTPEDYAKLVKHIVENDMINGETIRIDGAIRLAPK